MSLRRTPLTWSMYAANGAWASFVYLTGPISPILTEDLGVPRAASGLIRPAVSLAALSGTDDKERWSDAR